MKWPPFGATRSELMLPLLAFIVNYAWIVIGTITVIVEDRGSLAETAEFIAIIAVGTSAMNIAFFFVALWFTVWRRRRREARAEH